MSAPRGKRPRSNVPASPKPSPRPPSNVWRRQSPTATKPAYQQTLACTIKDECGACPHVNTPYADALQNKFDAGLALLRQNNVLAGARVLKPVKSPRELGYRSLFKLAVRADANGEAVLGLFKPGSHDIVDVASCPLHSQPLRRLVYDLREEINQLQISPYNETTGDGDLRYVAARAAHLTGELMVTFVVTKPMRSTLRRLVDALRRRGHKLHSAHMNINQQSGNAIFGDTTERVAGNDRLRERICDLDFEVGPTSFFQINPWQAINLYRRLEQIIGKSDKQAVAWDLYCGIGQISLILARAGYQTLGIEEIEAATKDAEANANRNKLGRQVSFLAGRTEDLVGNLPDWAKAPHVAVVNPSRRGLAPEVRKAITRKFTGRGDRRLIYVSCAADTLARDLAEFSQAGLRVRQLEAFDMFPQTDHMEWLAVVTP